MEVLGYDVESKFFIVNCLIKCWGESRRWKGVGVGIYV